MTHQTESDAGWDEELVPTAEGRSSEPHRDCPVELALEAVSGRWTTLVVRDLMHGDKSYSALAKGLPKLSDKVLADVLARLRERGLVCRTVVRGFPNRTIYGLTADGRSLRPLLVELYRTGARLRQSPRAELCGPRERDQVGPTDALVTTGLQ